MDFFKKITNPFNHSKQQPSFTQEGGSEKEKEISSDIVLPTLQIEPKTAEQYHFKMAASGISPNEWIEDMIDNMPALHGPTTLKLKVMSVDDLGLDHAATTAEIYARAKEMGMSLCPAQVGPELLLQYFHDQSLETLEFLKVAMESIKDGSGSENVFQVIFTPGKGADLAADHGFMVKPHHIHEKFIFTVSE